jgi:hypothetical protein
MSGPAFLFRSSGRLGNQMSQYAFCHALARRRRRGFAFLIDDPAIARFFRLGSPWERLRVSGRMARMLSACRPLLGRQVDVESWATPAEALRLVEGSRSISGYFQGEAFLEGCEAEIRQLFAWHADVDELIRSETIRRGWDDLSRTAVVHVRRGDYVACGSPRLGGMDLTMPARWFSTAAARLTGIERAIVISDDVPWCRSYLDLPWPWQASGADVTVDLALLRGAKACILSPSSLAWWGAWLNTRQDVQIVAPRFWLGHRVAQEYPPQVVTSSWIQA